jgi:hypothetical protein
MKKILYIGTLPNDTILAGGDALNRRNLSLIQQIKGEENVAVIDLPYVKSGWKKLLRSLCFNLSTFAGKNRRQILQELKGGEYGAVFFATSLYGKAVRAVKKKYPEVKLIAHYHNIERFLYKGLLMKSKTPVKSLLLFMVAGYNERLTAKYADIHIVLNERDAALFEQQYRKKPDLLLPVSYEDKFDEAAGKAVTPDKNVLFVGSDFLPNVLGIKWFIRQVVPCLSIPLIIVGKGMEKYGAALARENVTVVGSVDDIAPYYYNATCVVMPIFVGGGMKTKTAEAFMYGKTVLGTKESLEGYALNEKAGKECNTAQEFIAAINRMAASDAPKWNPFARQLYLEKYAVSATASRLREVLP